MNTTINRSFSIIFLLTACFFISADAQRDRGTNREPRGNSYSNREGGNNSNRGNGDFNRQRNVDRAPDPNRGNNNNGFNRGNNNNSSVDRRGNDTRVADRNPINGNNSTFRRNSIPNLNNDRNTVRNAVLGTQHPTDMNSRFGNNRTVIVNNNVRVNNYNNYSRYPRVYNYDRYGGYSFSRYNYYYPRRYVYVGAPRYSIMPRTFISINFGGYPYWYDRGCFYGYYDGFYEPVFAPFGIRVNILPIGYYPIYIGPSLYYYYEGVYYRRYHDNSDEYEVVDAPMDAVVKSLPKGATKVVLNGEKFYEFNGNYYKEGTNSKNEVVYTVVGKNGVINNTDDQQQASIVPQAPEVGDEITALPENSKQVTINGEVLYVTPDNFYLKAQTINSTTTYKVIGKAEKN
jgi:hypothetical protein